MVFAAKKRSERLVTVSLGFAAGVMLSVSFADLMPLVPLVWQNGTVVCSRDVTGVSASVSGVFYSLANLAVA